MSPLRDESTKDSVYLRDMWQEYTRNASFKSETRPEQIRRSPEQVHSYLKKLEEGVDSEDAQTLQAHADKSQNSINGAINAEDVKMQQYLIKQYQKKKY